jgi:hypothetical protein
MNEVRPNAIQPTAEIQLATNSLSTDAVEGQDLPAAEKEPICWTYHFGIIDPKRLHSEQDWGLPSQYSKTPEVSDISSATLHQENGLGTAVNDSESNTQVGASMPPLSLGISSTWTVLFLVFFVLVLTGTIGWPWIYVFAPLIPQVGILVAAFVSIGTLYVVRNRFWGAASVDTNYSPI